ncbi:hypothetical protein [Aminobacter sp. MDW-2]|uniref:hypothetical protein n=1 Tax=Aminobacter sp. MDW-2 TaxID=2666139 RepID=UPI0012B131E6|nr:hypothetical protein [Aminobacter sp. MDW-2]MRX33211.1 hypothetical protein [Aminobacter sp. MDW-2]QNH36834.1 hypothetical protein H5P29_13570 [Aminobacter sp. MDW-2]
MATFRIETDYDSGTGLIYAELYYPKNATSPSAVTKPIYHSHENAALDVINMFKKAFPDKPIRITPP